MCHSDASTPSAALHCRYSAALPIYLRALRIYEAKLGNMEGHDSDEHVQATLPCTQQSGITLTTLAHAHAACRSLTAVGSGLLPTKSVDSYRPRLGVHMCTMCAAHACACAHMQRARASVRVCVRASRQRQS